jgi:hypothetical protein
VNRPTCTPGFVGGLAGTENLLTYRTKAAQRGHSSVGRALALQARGRRFDPGWLHSRNLCNCRSLRLPGPGRPISG